MTRRCAYTSDLLAIDRADDLVCRYDEDRVRATTLRSRIARAVAETLHDDDRDRAEIAADMSDWLGEEVSPGMLDAYASAAKGGHTISYLRLIALVHATGDVRPLTLGADLFGYAVIDERFLPWVEAGQAAEVREQAEKAEHAARQRARRTLTGGRR